MALDDAKRVKLGIALAWAMVIYGSIVTYINGCIAAIPNIHTYVLVPVCLLASCALLLNLNKGIRLCREAAVFVPYAFLVVIRYLLASTFDMSALWVCCMIVLFLSFAIDLKRSFPYSVLLFFGYWECAGILLQMVLPSFYNSSIATLFVSADSIISLAKDYGYAGFFFQVGYASLTLVFAECVCLAHSFDTASNPGRRLLYVVQAIIFIVFIALTGKRGTTLIAVIIPLIMLVADNHTRKYGLLAILFCSVLGIFAMTVLLKYEEAFSGIHLLERLSRSIGMAKNGVDFTSGRLVLWSKAIEIFMAHPILGTGMHTFWNFSGTGMDPHNAYLEVLCEQGLVGFVLFVIPLAVCIAKTIRCYNSVSQGSRFAIAFSFAVQLEFVLDSFMENTISTNMIELILFLCSIAVMNSVACSETPDSSIIWNPKAER